MVKRVQEVGTKLYFHRLRNREIFLHANVSVDITWSNDWTLRRTISKCAGRGLGECTWAKPLDTLRADRLGIDDRSITVGTILGAACPRTVASRGGKRK